MEFIKELESKSNDLLKHLREQLSGIRGSRPTTKLAENIVVDYMGQKSQIKQLGSLSVGLPREIQILAWDSGAVQNIAKAVEAALGLKPNADGNSITIHLPPLSEERRQELVKIVKREVEEVRIRLRAFRDEILKKIRRAEDEKTITEDDKFKLKNRIEENMKKFNEEVEKLADGKIKEIEE